MTAHPPPVPEEQRAPHEQDERAAATTDGKPHDQAKSGNVAQNTTNKGFQQDR